MENIFSINVNIGNVSIATLPAASLKESASFFMMPWLLPVMVAVSMVMFLVISFALYHKRYLLKRKKSIQYHLIHYHRVAGPRTPPEMVSFINDLPGTSSAGPGDAPAENASQQGKRVESPVKLSDTLRRCYSLSPRHLKERASRYEGKRCDAAHALNKRASHRDIPGVHLGTACDKGCQCLHPDHVSFLQATTVQSLAKLKSRAVVVTTVNGVLARASLASLGDPEIEDVLEYGCDKDSGGEHNVRDLRFIDDMDFEEFTAGRI